MKKIVFLIIATLLVLGLVLPGCTTTTTPRTYPLVAGEISIAVCGPMDDVQGEHHWAGATLARDEINALPNKIDIGGTPHTVKLVEVDTNEIGGLPDEGVLALRAAIAGVDFVVGGFRTESVSAYRLEAMKDKVIFMNCGAATGALQQSVNTDYTQYKYWFKATPYNEVFLCTSMLKLTANAAANLVGNLLGYGPAPGAGFPYIDTDYAITGTGTTPDPYVAKIAIFGESLSWCDGIVTLAQERLPELLMPSKNITLDVVGTWLVSDTKTDIGTEMGEIAAEKPHLIFTIFSGPVGKVYSKARADMALPALSVGINVEGQLQGMVDYTTEGCEYDIMLDTWAYGVNQTSLTSSFLSTIMSASYADDYPLYTAAAYDAIYALKADLEAVDSVDPANMIPWLEDPANGLVGTGSANTTYYPKWDTVTKGDYKAGTADEELDVMALNENQVLEYYPWLDGLTIMVDGSPTAWAWNADNWTVEGGFIAHDTVYGPGYQTGLGSQWQDVEGTLRKVGFWPSIVPDYAGLAGLNPLQVQGVIGAGGAAAMWYAGLIDQYGFWNFEYDGTVPIQIPLSWWLSGAPNI